MTGKFFPSSAWAQHKTTQPVPSSSASFRFTDFGKKISIFEMHEKNVSLCVNDTKLG